MSSDSCKLSEEEIINSFKKQFATIKSHKDLWLPIGDDCAAFGATFSPTSEDSQGQDTSFVLTTDSLVEGVHFLKGTSTPFQVGYKSLAVNLSDIAAMGAKPLYVTLSLSLPTNLEQDWVEEFKKGFYSLAKKYEVSLIGGDTTRSIRDIFINVTAIGCQKKTLIKQRTTAKEKDFICVSREIGDSALGLNLLNNEKREGQAVNQLISRHCQPEPEVELGQWLAYQAPVHAMMDVSDGLYMDLKKMMSASSLSASIDAEKLPLSAEATEFSKDCEQAPWHWALSGGEDYALLFTVAEEAIQKFQDEYEKRWQRPLFVVGQVENSKKKQRQERVRIFLKEKEVVVDSSLFYQHFLDVKKSYNSNEA